MVTVTAQDKSTIEAIRMRAHFTKGNLRGRAGGGLASDNMLPPQLREQYETDLMGCGVTYTVYSYTTPVAWVLRDGTVRASGVAHSRTTRRHQALASHALLP